MPNSFLHCVSRHRALVERIENEATPVWFRVSEGGVETQIAKPHPPPCRKTMLTTCPITTSRSRSAALIPTIPEGRFDLSQMRYARLALNTAKSLLAIMM